jgi:ketosteroid isomerase-like protein
MTLFAARASAQTATEPAKIATTDPAIAEIDQMRQGLVEAFDKKDVDKLLSYLHPQIVVTWQNGEVSKGRDEVKAYYTRMMVGDNRIVESVEASPVVEGRSLMGDTSISYGHMNDTFKLKDGSEFHLDSRFSAWLVREDGHWLLRGFHLSANVFDNDIQKMVVKKTATWTGIGAGAAGLLLGLILARAFRGRAKTA